MVVVIFRSRRTPEASGEEYRQRSVHMRELGYNMPGFISSKAFSAEDGEQVTLLEWESVEAVRAWAEHPEHMAVKKWGREHAFFEYRSLICEVVQDSKFERGRRS